MLLMMFFVLFIFHAGLQNAQPTHHVSHVRGHRHLVQFGAVSAQYDAAGRLQFGGQAAEQLRCAVRGLHSACLPQERTAAHRLHDGPQLNRFAQSAGAGRLEARSRCWRRRPRQFAADGWRIGHNELDDGDGRRIAHIFVFF